LTAVCANLAEYDATFTACVTGVGGCSASGSMIVSQAEALLPAIQAACAASPTLQAPVSNPSTAYANQISKRKTMAYLTEYADLNIIRNANLANMDVLIYAFIHLGSDGTCSFGASNMTNINFALAQRATFPNLQVVLSVGATAQVFASATSTAVTRAAFAQNCVGLMNQVNADGLDIDWEFPQASDAANLLATVQLLRATLGSSKTLSFVTSAHISNVMNPALPSLAPYLDWYGVMSYSYGNIGLQSSSATTSDLDNIVRTLLSVGLQPSQIVIGIPFYGFTCKLPSSGDPSILVNCVAASDNAVQANGAAGTSVFNNFTFAQYTFLPNGTVLVYNTPQSAQLKAQYVVDHALYGLMIWEFSQDSTFAMYNTISSVFETAPVTPVSITIPGNSATGYCNGTVLNPQCGGAAFNWGACPMSQCCAQNNKCSSDPKLCLGTAKPVCPISPAIVVSQGFVGSLDAGCNPNNKFFKRDYFCLFGSNNKPIKRELFEHTLCKLDTFLTLNGHLFNTTDYLDDCEYHRFLFVDFLDDCEYHRFLFVEFDKHFEFLLFEFDVFLAANGHRVNLNHNNLIQ
ncbi:hypothetical protein HDU98_000579, partial [Podochytrium sp. JEL0797]